MAWPDSDFPDGIEIGDAVDVALGGGVEEFVDEDRGVDDGGRVDGVGHVVVELLFIGDDFHGSAAEDEAGADEDGVADSLGDFAGFGEGAGDAVFGLAEV